MGTVSVQFLLCRTVGSQNFGDSRFSYSCSSWVKGEHAIYRFEDMAGACHPLLIGMSHFTYVIISISNE